MVVKSGCSSTIRTGMVTSWELQRQRPRSPYCHGCASPIGQHKLCSILIGQHRTGWSAANVFHFTYETGLTSFWCCLNWQNIWICPGSSSEPPESRSQRVFKKRRTSSIVGIWTLDVYLLTIWNLSAGASRPGCALCETYELLSRIWCRVWREVCKILYFKFLRSRVWNFNCLIGILP